MRWSLHVEPAHCVLEKQNSATGFSLSIDTTPGSDSYRMAIAGDGISVSATLKPASLTFAPSQKIATGLARVVKLPNGAIVTVMQGLPSSLLDDLSGASTVTLEVKRGQKSTVTVTGTTKAVDALRKCNADQLVEWGADPSQFAPGGTMPNTLKPRDEWISNDEFLKLAGQSKRQSTNDDFRVLVSTDGVVTECHATIKGIEPELEKGVCAAVVGRRLFSPAKSASGNAVIGAATFNVSLIRQLS